MEKTDKDKRIILRKKVKVILKHKQSLKERMLKQLNELEEKLENVNKEIKELEAAGIKESDAADIMNALHKYNEIKDTVTEVFGVFIKLTQVSSATLHKKYKIPEE